MPNAMHCYECTCYCINTVITERLFIYSTQPRRLVRPRCSFGPNPEIFRAGQTANAPGISNELLTTYLTITNFVIYQIVLTHHELEIWDDEEISTTTICYLDDLYCSVLCKHFLRSLLFINFQFKYSTEK